MATTCGATRLRSARPRSHLSWPRPSCSQGADMLGQDQWEDVFSNVRGNIHRGLEKLKSSSLLNIIGADGLSHSERHEVAKRIKPLMRSLGWNGPRNVCCRSFGTLSVTSPACVCCLRLQLPARVSRRASVSS